MFRVVVNGSEYKVGIEELAEETTTQPSQPAVTTPAPAPVQSKPAPQPTKPKQTTPDAGHSGGTIPAPMPGTVISIAVAPGDSVTKGQTLMVLEAMKMENQILAPSDGTVKELGTSTGESVNAGDTLIVLSL